MPDGSREGQRLTELCDVTSGSQAPPRRAVVAGRNVSATVSFDDVAASGGCDRGAMYSEEADDSAFFKHSQPLNAQDLTFDEIPRHYVPMLLTTGPNKTATGRLCFC